MFKSKRQSTTTQDTHTKTEKYLWVSLRCTVAASYFILYPKEKPFLNPFSDSFHEFHQVYMGLNAAQEAYALKALVTNFIEM